MSFFVKYPPNGDKNVLTPKNWEPCMYAIAEPYYNVCRFIEQHEARFNETGNDLHVFEAFRLATSVRLYPPLWVISRLQDRLTYWHKNKLTLDRAFGLTGEGLGKGRRTSLADAARLRIRNKVLCMLVFKLQAVGLTRPQACKALASFLARIPEGHFVSLPGDPDKTRLKRIDITGKGLEKAISESEHGEV